MEKDRCKESTQDTLDTERKGALPVVDKLYALSSAPVGKSGMARSQVQDSEVVSFTPEKRNEHSQSKHRDRLVELPVKYKIITEFFDRMNCALRLLTLCKKLPTFFHIRPMVEKLTQRKFSYKHLAQIKYILPEAVHIEKLLIHDEKTLCMLPDMKITLLFDVIDGHREHSPYGALRKLFSSRIITFLDNNPKGCDIPEAILPVLYSQINEAMVPKVLPVDLSTDSQGSQPMSSGTELSSDSSCHFSRHLGQRSNASVSEDTKLLSSPCPSSFFTSDDITSQNIKIAQYNSSSELYSNTDSKPSPQLKSPQILANPAACESPSLKPSLVADKLTVETPVQLTPERPISSFRDNLKTISVIKGTSCEKPAKRSLDFSHLEGDESGYKSNEDESEYGEVVPHTIKQTERAEENYIVGSSTFLQKVEVNSDCLPGEEKMSQMDPLMGKEKPSCLTDIVALIYHIFKGVHFASITKEELVYKIIMKNYDIVERREVEEQLELLEKLVPGWLSRIFAPSGDLLYFVKRAADLESILARLN